MEREATERYAEFARRMADEGNDRVAALRRRTEGVALPPLEADYSWLDSGAPETQS